MRAEVGLEQAEAPLVGAHRALEAVRREARRRQSAGGRPARMETLGPGAVLEELHAAGGHAEREALGVGQRARVVVLKVARGQRRAEHADDACGMEADLLPPAPRVLADARIGLHGEQVGAERARAARAGLPAGREHHRQRARGGVHDARRVRVVVIEAVDQDAVQQRRVAQRPAFAHADQHVFAAAGERADAGGAALGELEAGRGEGDAERIQDAAPGGVQHLRRHGPGVEAVGVLREPLRKAPRERAGRGWRVRGGTHRQVRASGRSRESNPTCPDI